MQSHDKYKSTIGFIDILFNILVGFAFLFIVAFLLIKPEAKREDFDRKAEFIIVMEWDSERQDDIDLYVEETKISNVGMNHNKNFGSFFLSINIHKQIMARVINPIINNSIIKIPLLHHLHLLPLVNFV